MIVALFMLLGDAHGLDNGFNLPALGWSSWYASPSGSGVTEKFIKAATTALVSSGLAAKGYVYVNVDEGWLKGRHDSNHSIYEDREKFPSGMRALGDWVRSQPTQDGSKERMKYGLYSSRGTCQCGTSVYHGPGSHGFERADTQWMVDAGAEWLKIDSCCGSQDHATAFADYARFRDAMNATGKRVWFNLCGWRWWYAPPDPSINYTGGASLGNSWRIYGDGGNFGAITGALNTMSRDYVYDQTRAGAYSDPDNILGPHGTVGRVSEGQARLQMVMWSFFPTQLILGEDVTRMSAEVRSPATHASLPTKEKHTPCLRPPPLYLRHPTCFHLRHICADIWPSLDFTASQYVETVGNEELIGINQDAPFIDPARRIVGDDLTYPCSEGGRLGRAGALVEEEQETSSTASSCTNIWGRRLANGDVALAMLNHANTSTTLTCDAACLAAAATGLTNATSISVRDLLRHADLPVLLPPFELSSSVPGDGGVSAFRLTPTYDSGSARSPSPAAALPAAIEEAAPQSTPLRVACVGDSITAGYLASNQSMAYPGRLQKLLDAAHPHAYSVVNLGAGGATLQKNTTSPYWKRKQFDDFLKGTWDIVIMMLGTNDAHEEPADWPAACSSPAATAETCSYIADYHALIKTARSRTSTHAPLLAVAVPPPLMREAAYGMNQTVINDILPRLIPRIAMDAALPPPRTLPVAAGTA